MATEFHRFPDLPFEIRELIWQEAAFQPVGEDLPHSSSPNSDTKLITWHSRASYLLPLAEGEWVAYQERGRRAPAIAHACHQARTVALKNHTCCPGPRAPKTPKGKIFWEVRTDAVLITSISPRATLGRNARLIAAGCPSVVLHMSAFTQAGTSPLYLFEFLKRAGMHTSLGAKVVVQEVALEIPCDTPDELFGRVEGKKQMVQLVDVRNLTLQGKFMRSAGRRKRLVWPGMTDFDPEAVVAQDEIHKLEDLWIDCQYSAWLPARREKEKREVLDNAKRYKREHPWVRDALDRMPKFEPVVMFRASIGS